MLLIIVVLIFSIISLKNSELIQIFIALIFFFIEVLKIKINSKKIKYEKYSEKLKNISFIAVINN